jgi:hypothetical protein
MAWGAPPEAVAKDRFPMGIHYELKKADRIIRALGPRSHQELVALCRIIQAHQDDLNTAAAPLFDACGNRCKGLCCQNIHPDQIISSTDLVFILASNPTIREELVQRASDECFFSSRCPFLKNMRGPCLFPSNQKPLTCIVTFCQDTRSVRGEIKRLRSDFRKLYRFLLFARLEGWGRRIKKAFGSHG